MAKRVWRFWEGSFPVNGNVKQTPEQKRISELERKQKDAEIERDILKKKQSFKTVDDLYFH
jgi:transposase